MPVHVHLSILLSLYSSIAALGPEKKLCIHKYCFYQALFLCGL